MASASGFGDAVVSERDPDQSEEAEHDRSSAGSQQFSMVAR
jgi:hypothetical protein